MFVDNIKHTHTHTQVLIQLAKKFVTEFMNPLVRSFLISTGV